MRRASIINGCRMKWRLSLLRFRQTRQNCSPTWAIRSRPKAPWGAAEAILVGPPADPDAASSGNDAMAASKPVPGRLYGAHDDRRPAGAAGGY